MAGAYTLPICRNQIKKKNRKKKKGRPCYRPNLKPWKDSSKGIIKKEIWYTHPENLELLGLKEMKLAAFS